MKYIKTGLIIAAIAAGFLASGCSDELEEQLPHITAGQAEQTLRKAFPQLAVTCVNISFIEVEDDKRYEGMNRCIVTDSSGRSESITQTFYVLRDGDDWHWKATDAR